MIKYVEPEAQNLDDITVEQIIQAARDSRIDYHSRAQPGDNFDSMSYIANFYDYSIDMLNLIFNRSKPVYQYFDEREDYSYSGFYFRLNKRISGSPIFCFIGDPKKSSEFLHHHFENGVCIDGKRYILPYGLKVEGSFGFSKQTVKKLPTAIGKIALTAEPLCMLALESFVVKIEMEREVQNLQYQHSQEQIEQMQSTIREIDSQLKLFATNLVKLFERIVKEQNLLNGDGGLAISQGKEFANGIPTELTRRNEELQRLLAQFDRLDK